MTSAEDVAREFLAEWGLYHSNVVVADLAALILRERKEADARAEAAEAESARLREALTEMESMYTHCWDLADGGDKLMMEKSVGRFDEACRKARIALGTPLYGDNGEVFE